MTHFVRPRSVIDWCLFPYVGAKLIPSPVPTARTGLATVVSLLTTALRTQAQPVRLANLDAVASAVKARGCIASPYPAHHPLFLPAVHTHSPLCHA